MASFNASPQAPISTEWRRVMLSHSSPRVPLALPDKPLTYIAPAGARWHYISGLLPHSGHPIVQAGNQITVTAGGSAFTDAAGLLAFNPALGGFENWCAIHFGRGFSDNPAAAPSADADSDGVSHLFEYIAGTHPVTPSLPSMVHTATRAGTVTCQFQRADASESPDLILMLQTSSDLSAWPQSFPAGATTAASGPGVTVAKNGTAPDTITVTFPAAVPRQFIRLPAHLTP